MADTHTPPETVYIRGFVEGRGMPIIKERFMLCAKSIFTFIFTFRGEHFFSASLINYTHTHTHARERKCAKENVKFINVSGNVQGERVVSCYSGIVRNGHTSITHAI